MQYLTIEDIENICYEIVKAHLTFDEPLPSFETRYKGKLESAIFSPQRSAYGKDAYTSLPKKAAVLFYEMIKQHPFLNGNKRMACVSLMVFLSLNGRWFDTTWNVLYLIAKDVSNSETKDRETTVEALEEIIDTYTRDLKVEELQ